jgi:hypothetical protein
MKLLNEILLFLTIILLQDGLIRTQNEPNENMPCLFNSNSSELICEDFRPDLNDVPVPNNLKNESNTTPIQIIRLKAAEAIPFKVEYVDLEAFFPYVSKNVSVYLSNFNSVDIRLTPFMDLLMENEKDYQRLYLEDNFVTKFEINDQDLNNDCTLDLNGFKRNEFFHGFSELYWRRVNFKDASKLCPLIFKNTTLKKLEIDTVNKSNKFEFVELADSVRKRVLNSNIEQLDILNAELETLDQTVLSKKVFEKLRKLSYSESIFEPENELFLKIEPNLFTSFEYLTEFSLSINRMESFFKNADSLDWLFKSINYKEMNEFKLILTDLSQQYEFPDSDLCLFKEFPHDRKVFPIINTKANLTCSCTLRWLLKNSKNLTLADNDVNEMNTPSVANCFESENNAECNEIVNFGCPTSPPPPTTTTTRPPRSTRPTRPLTVTPQIVPQTKPVDTNSDSTLTIVAVGVGAVTLLVVTIMVIFIIVDRKRRLKLKGEKTVFVKDEFINIISR